MGIRIAVKDFILKPSIGRNIAAAGAVGAGAAALGHLISMPGDQQEAVVAEADERGLSTGQLILGALLLGGAADMAVTATNSTYPTVIPIDDTYVEDVEEKIRAQALIDEEFERYVAQRPQRKNKG